MPYPMGYYEDDLSWRHFTLHAFLSPCVIYRFGVRLTNIERLPATAHEQAEIAAFSEAVGGQTVIRVVFELPLSKKLNATGEPSMRLVRYFNYKNGVVPWHPKAPGRLRWMLART